MNDFCFFRWSGFSVGNEQIYLVFASKSTEDKKGDTTCDSADIYFSKFAAVTLHHTYQVPSR